MGMDVSRSGIELRNLVAASEEEDKASTTHLDETEGTPLFQPRGMQPMEMETDVSRYSANSTEHSKQRAQDSSNASGPSAVGRFLTSTLQPVKTSWVYQRIKNSIKTLPDRLLGKSATGPEDYETLLREDKDFLSIEDSGIELSDWDNRTVVSEEDEQSSSALLVEHLAQDPDQSKTSSTPQKAKNVLMVQPTYLPRSVDLWLIKNHRRVIETPPTEVSIEFRAKELKRMFQKQGVKDITKFDEKIRELATQEREELLANYNKGIAALEKQSTYQWLTSDKTIASNIASGKQAIRGQTEAQLAQSIGISLEPNGNAQRSSRPNDDTQGKIPYGNERTGISELGVMRLQRTSEGLHAFRKYLHDSCKPQDKQPALSLDVKIEEQGLGNCGVDCYLNSALQCLRDRFSLLSKEQQENILDSLQKKYQVFALNSQIDGTLANLGSPLAAFLQYKFDGRDKAAAAFLRLEIQNILAGVDNGAAKEIADNIDGDTGISKNQQDACIAMNGLIEALGIPGTIIDEQSSTPGEMPTNKDITEGIIPLAIPSDKDSKLEDLVIASWTSKVTQDGNEVSKKQLLKDPPSSITFQVKRFGYLSVPDGDDTGVYLKQSKGELLLEKGKFSSKHVDTGGNPIPVKLNTPITNITEEVRIPRIKDPEGEAYTPSSIICHVGQELTNSGHYVTYRRVGDKWYLANDGTTEEIKLDNKLYPTLEIDSDMTHREFLERNAYVVNLKRVNETAA